MMAVYNESDIVEQVIDHLVSQGIQLVIIDNGSTDGSYEICSEHVGKGVLVLKRLVTERFESKRILKELGEMALSQNPSWQLLSDADAFLESPYSGLTLHDAVELEAEKGHNLIQFHNFEFWPTEKDHMSLEKDVRKRIKYYSWHDDDQFRCWKTYPGVIFHESFGHYPMFPAGVRAKVSPNKFIWRHYKIRSYEHGLRKVFNERLLRYNTDERNEGGHVHYNNLKPDKNYFIIDSTKLTKYQEDGNWNLTKTFDGSFGAWNPPSADEKIWQHELSIESLDWELNRTLEQLNQTRSELNQTRSELNAIKGSFGYCFMHFYASRIDRLFPEGTARGKLRKMISTRLQARVLKE
jgi:glycosyltransferase involved in cell wall biosynthesis